MQYMQISSPRVVHLKLTECSLSGQLYLCCKIKIQIFGGILCSSSSCLCGLSDEVFPGHPAGQQKPVGSACVRRGGSNARVALGAPPRLPCQKGRLTGISVGWGGPGVCWERGSSPSTGAASSSGSGAPWHGGGGPRAVQTRRRAAAV